MTYGDEKIWEMTSWDNQPQILDSTKVKEMVDISAVSQNYWPTRLIPYRFPIMVTFQDEFNKDLALFVLGTNKWRQVSVFVFFLCIFLLSFIFFT